MASQISPADDRIVVKPRVAAVMLGCGITRLYELIAAREIESFKDGRSRKISVSSIREYVARRLSSSIEHTNHASLPRAHGRPRKTRSATEATQ